MENMNVALKCFMRSFAKKICHGELSGEDNYEPIRSRLASAVPQPKVITGGHFLTLDTLGETDRKKKAETSTAEEAAGSQETPPGELSSPVSSTPSPKRAADPVARWGLVHVASIHHTVPVPAELQKLAYAAVILELTQSDFAENGNTMIQRLIIAGVPILVVGSGVDVDEALRFVRRVEDEIQKPMHKVTIELCRPAGRTGGGVYRYVSHRMVLLTNIPIPFKVSAVHMCR